MDRTNHWYRDHRALLLALLLACVVATCVMVPRVDDLRLNQDFPLYDAAAHHILDGDFVLHEFGRNAPGWPLYLAFIYLTIGSSGTALAISQILLHIVFVLLIYAIAKEVASGRIPWIVALLAAVWPSFLFQIRHGSSALLYAVVFTAVVFFFIRALKEESVWRALVCGILLGLGALTDVIALFLPIVFALWALVDGVREKEKRERIGKRVVIVAIMCSAVALVILPWTYRNIFLYEDFSVAPVIAKGEQNYLRPESIRKTTRSLFAIGEPMFREGFVRVFSFPVGLHTLDSGATFSYKERGVEILRGQQGIADFSPKERNIFIVKILLTILHLAVLVGALVTCIRLRIRGFSLLVFLLTVYIFVAIISTATLSSFDSISLANGFLVPITPLLLILAITGYVSRIRAQGGFSVHDIL